MFNLKLLSQPARKKVIDTIVLSVTPLCNFRCQMCRCWETKWSKEVLSDKILISSIKKLAKYFDAANCISITGGEPLLRKNIVHVVRECFSAGFETTLTTNASLLTDAKITQLSEAGLSRFNISLDSMCPEKHDKIRGFPGSHAKVMQALRAIGRLNKEIMPQVIIMPLIMKANIEEIQKMVEWCQSNDIITNISFQVLSTPPRYYGKNWPESEEFKSLCVTDSGVANAAIDKLIDYMNNGFKIGNTLEQLENFRYYLLNQKYANFGICNIDRNSIFIDEYGMLRVCPYKNPIGNMKMNKIEEIISRPYPPKLLSDIKNCGINCNSRINCSVPGRN